jgi:hypothetical protein
MSGSKIFIQGASFYIDDSTNGLRAEELYESDERYTTPRNIPTVFTWSTELTIWQSSLIRTTSSCAPSVNKESPEKGGPNPADLSSANNVKRT